MSGQEYEVPMSVTIAIPTERPRVMGVHSNTSPEAGRIHVRCNAREMTVVDQACELLSINRAAFGRDCIVNAAIKIIEGYNAHHSRRTGG